MKIGILGSGVVGRTLADGFIEDGHEVMIGTRDPSKLDEWQSKNRDGRIGSFDEAAAFGEVVVLAVKGTAALDALGLASASHLAGKVVIDTTNPIVDFAAPVHGVLNFFTGIGESLMERLQREVPAARFVKAFNSVGSTRMVRPQFDGGRPTMFICGNDDAARQSVRELLDAFGWDTEDMGMAEAARAIEPLAILWCIPGFLNNQWTHAFKLLR